LTQREAEVLRAIGAFRRPTCATAPNRWSTPSTTVWPT